MMTAAAVGLSPEPICLRLFGGFRACAGDVDVTPKGRKARAIIAYLSLSDRGEASRDQLAGLLWSDRGEEQARASLRQSLTELRSGAIGGSGLLDVGRDAVRIVPAMLDTDLAAADRAAVSGDLATLASSLAGVRGDLLDQLDGLSPAFDDWLSIERPRRLEALVTSSTAAVAHAAAEPALAAAVLAELERLDPGNEVIARLGLSTSAQSGDLGGLHRRYKRLSDTLQREFGAQPSPETRALFESLRKGEGPTSAPASRKAETRRSLPSSSADEDAPPLLHVGAFLDGSGGANAGMAAAIRAEVLAGLSRFRDLRLGVASETSQAEAYSLVASIRTGRAGLIVAPQLTRHDGELVWAERFDLLSDDLQPGIDLLVGRIVAAVLPALMTDVVETIAPRPEAGLYTRFLLVKHASHRPDDHDTALAAARELEAIIAADPKFVSPKLALARIYDTDHVWTRAGSSGPAERARAFELSRQALALDRDNVNAWTHVGWSHLWHGNWSASKQAFDAAMTLNPYNVARLLEVAFGSIFLGDLEGSAALIEDCLRIEPRPGDALHGDRGLLRLVQGDFDGAAADFAMILEPDLWMCVHAAANAALAGLAGSDERERAEAALVRLFPSGRMPPLNKLLEWVNGCHPFRYAEHREQLIQGVKAAFS